MKEDVLVYKLKGEDITRSDLDAMVDLLAKNSKEKEQFIFTQPLTGIRIFSYLKTFMLIDKLEERSFSFGNQHFKDCRMFNWGRYVFTVIWPSGYFIHPRDVLLMVDKNYMPEFVERLYAEKKLG